MPQAARLLEISERAVHKRIAAGTLRAEPFGRSYRVWLPEAPPPGPEPGPAVGPDPGPEQGPEPIEARFRARCYRLAGGLRATGGDPRSVAPPLVERIAEQAETIGRLEAERDAARAELAALKASPPQDAPHASPADTSGAEAHAHLAV